MFGRTSTSCSAPPTTRRSHTGTSSARGTKIPYLSHLWAVASLVLEHGGDDHQVAAALLHDVVEDCGGQSRLDDVRREFGVDISVLVEALSDSVVDTDAGDTKAPWRERKTAYLEHLRQADRRVALVSACDKLHNARCILADLRVEGPQLWERFNASDPQRPALVLPDAGRGARAARSLGPRGRAGPYGRRHRDTRRRRLSLWTRATEPVEPSWGQLSVTPSARRRSSSALARSSRSTSRSAAGRSGCRPASGPTTHRWPCAWLSRSSTEASSTSPTSCAATCSGAIKAHNVISSLLLSSPNPAPPAAPPRPTHSPPPPPRSLPGAALRGATNEAGGGGRDA